MSASINPTRAPWLASAMARLDATVDFPTPPLPLDTAMMLPRCGYATGVGAGTAARCDWGSCPITGSARDGPLRGAAAGVAAFDCVAPPAAAVRTEAFFA